MFKNRPQQRWRVFAFNIKTNEPVSGDEANITAKIRQDWGTPTPLADTNPDPITGEPGFYEFLPTDAEVNGDALELYPVSSTPDVQVIDARSFAIADPPDPWVYIDPDTGRSGAIGTIRDPFDTLESAIGATPRWKYFPRVGGVLMSAFAIPNDAMIDFQGASIGLFDQITAFGNNCRFVSSIGFSRLNFNGDLNFGSATRFTSIWFDKSVATGQMNFTDSAFFNDCKFIANNQTVVVSLPATGSSVSIFSGCEFGREVGEPTFVISGPAVPSSADIKLIDCEGDVRLKGDPEVFTYYGNGKLVIDPSVTSGTIFHSNGVSVLEDDLSPWDYDNTTNRPTVVLVHSAEQNAPILETGGPGPWGGVGDQPAIGDVRLGVVYAGGTLTGACRVPPIEKVESGYAFDDSDSLTGVLDPGDMPAENDVIAGVIYASGTMVGTNVSPDESTVLAGTLYGAGGVAKTGTLEVSAVSENEMDVAFSINQGDDYLGANAVTIGNPQAVDLTDSEIVLIIARDRAGYDQLIETKGQDNGTGDPTFELTSDETADLKSGTWRYQCVAKLSDESVRTINRGWCQVVLRYGAPA